MTAHVSFVNVSEAVGWDTGVRRCGLVDHQVVEVTGLFKTRTAGTALDKLNGFHISFILLTTLVPKGQPLRIYKSLCWIATI